jgi:hypothetical protein
MDGADHLRKVAAAKGPTASVFFTANCSVDRLRAAEGDTRPEVLTHNAFPCSPYGVLWSSNPNTLYTPGLGEQAVGTDRFHLQDWLGSARYVTDISGSTVTAAQRYDAFGSIDWQAPGSPNHPSDLMFAGAGATRRSGATGRARRGWGWTICSSGIMIPWWGGSWSRTRSGSRAG